MKQLFIILCIIFFACSCNREKEIIAFKENKELRFQVGQKVHFQYDPRTCQISFSRSKREFRCQTDNSSDYYLAVFQSIPANLGETVTANIEWTTPTEILMKKNVRFELVQIEGDMMWLWSNVDHIGLSIRLLE